MAVLAIYTFSTEGFWDIAIRSGRSSSAARLRGISKDKARNVFSVRAVPRNVANTGHVRALSRCKCSIESEQRKRCFGSGRRVTSLELRAGSVAVLTTRWPTSAAGSAAITCPLCPAQLDAGQLTQKVIQWS